MARAPVVLVLVAVCACGPSQVCRDYVRCQEAYDANVVTTPYQDGGACWVGTLQTADACTAQCAVALDALRELPTPPAACANEP